MVSRSWLVAATVVLGVWMLVFATSCKKSSADSSVIAALGPGDLNPDGTIKDAAMQDLDTRSKAGNSLHVKVVRAQIGDAGLNQLAKFKNLRHVEAFGSRITPAGIDRLKKAIPEVEVVK